MLIRSLWFAGLVVAQSLSVLSPSIVTNSGSGSITRGDVVPIPTITDPDLDGDSINTGTMSSSTVSIGELNATASTPSSSTTSKPLTTIVGGSKTTSGNMTTSASTTARPTNTQPCNNYQEFCTRRYSNITEVCAHNSPFVRKNNFASNQDFGVTQQLNDGVRMLQGQTHEVNGTMYYCHTSCDLLNAGTVEAYLTEVAQWVRTHPFDVITILIGNGDYQKKDAQGKPLITSKNFVEPIERAGLMQFIYQPPKTAMTVEDWPTLEQLIIMGKRVIMFIDYNFDTEAVPWMLWEFYNMWETPYSPTNIQFPCTVQRPEGLSENKTKSIMYMANHNLNVDVSIAGLNLLIPNTVELNVTNGLNGTGSLGLMSNQCTTDWGRPPNFLLVDYYNYGTFNGSVFEVAAQANNVTYNHDSCCGVASSAPPMIKKPRTTWAMLMACVSTVLFM